MARAGDRVLERRRARRLLQLFAALRTRYAVTDGWWPGGSAFEIMLGAVLVQRTQWRNAAAALARLRQRDLLSAEKLCGTSLRTLERCVRPSGFYRVKARRVHGLAQFVCRNGGIAALSTRSTRALRAALLDLEGIGAETADAILAFAFRRPVFVVDAYSARWLARVGVIGPADEGTPSPQPFPASKRGRRGRHSELIRARVEQALGHSARRLRALHAVIVEHSKHVCRAQPLCGRCPVSRQCDHGVARRHGWRGKVEEGTRGGEKGREGMRRD